MTLEAYNKAAQGYNWSWGEPILYQNTHRGPITFRMCDTQFLVEEKGYVLIPRSRVWIVQKCRLPLVEVAPEDDPLIQDVEKAQASSFSESLKTEDTNPSTPIAKKRGRKSKQ